MKISSAWFTLAFSLAFGSACSTSSQTKLPASEITSKSDVATPLTEVEARHRAEQVNDITYALWFKLNEKSESFAGRATLKFNLKQSAKDHDDSLFLDFYAGEIQNIVVNGTALTDIHDPTRYDDSRIFLKMSELIAGGNVIEVTFTHPYSRNGHGLHRFVDPVDQSVYVYSDLEPYFAHHIFPSFDQPDLKAQFQLTIDAPKKWQVISNTLETKTAPLDSELKEWTFPTTQKLSTYVIALVAGPYYTFHANADGIPMRLFSRKSLAKYVDAKEWFKITRKGLAFYGKKFNHPYPFLKYDQILVPEFNEGAMENAGAVTFSERMVYRTKKTRFTHEHRADIILHEMAHMWFGDLVTMKWWNGLWLNESFATFMSSWAMSETTPISGSSRNSAWEAFNGEKNWAYWQDQLVTTHPVELSVPDTDHAFSNFDGITYGKGASVIKQLRYYLGEDHFRKGIQDYFKNFAYGNTRLEDFMGSLGQASGIDLSSFQKVWLMTAGVNSLKVDWACADGKIAKLNLLQSPAENSTVLRPHRTEIGFYSKNVLMATLPVTYETALTEVKAALGKDCPDFIFPNVDDQDYVKVELDEKTLHEVLSHLSEIKDTLTKQILWNSLSEMVIDGKLSPKDYTEIALKQLFQEKNIRVQEEILAKLPQFALRFMRVDLREPYYETLEKLFKTGLDRSAPGSDAQLIWFNALVGCVHTPARIQYLRDIFDGKIRIPKLKIDQEVRWSIVDALSSRGVPDSEALIEKELKADPTDMGKKSALAARVSSPNPVQKNHWLEQVFAAAATGSTPEYNGSNLRTIMDNFHVLSQENLTAAMVDRYFQFLPTAIRSPDETYIERYTRDFFPSLCTQKVIDLTTKALKSDLPISAQKNLRVQKQENERCLRARNINRSGPPFGFAIDK